MLYILNYLFKLQSLNVTQKSEDLLYIKFSKTRQKVKKKSKNQVILD